MDWSKLNMGGYGFYVWGSYITAFVLMLGEVLLVTRRKRALLNREKENDAIIGSKEYETTS
jgi:heme exporter protein CcmD